MKRNFNRFDSNSSLLTFKKILLNFEKKNKLSLRESNERQSHIYIYNNKKKLLKISWRKSFAFSPTKSLSLTVYSLGLYILKQNGVTILKAFPFSSFIARERNEDYTFWLLFIVFCCFCFNYSLVSLLFKRFTRLYGNKKRDRKKDF